MRPSIGTIVADAWDMVQTLEGPTDFGSAWLYRALTGAPPISYREALKPVIKTGTWRGDRYWKVWNFRTGHAEWRRLHV